MPARKPTAIPDTLRDGTVTAIRAQAGDAERVAVFLDGAFAFGLAAEIALRAGLRKGRSLSAHEQRELLVAEQQGRARAAALELLSRQPRTRAEVRRRLERKGFDATSIEHAVARMTELGYLDDAAYAHTFVRDRLQTRGYGPRRIRAELLRRGLDAAIVTAALRAQTSEDDVRAAARQQAAARWRRLAHEDDPRRRRKKLYDFLARRGYDPEVIREVCDPLEREG